MGPSTAVPKGRQAVVTDCFNPNWSLSHLIEHLPAYARVSRCGADLSATSSHVPRLAVSSSMPTRHSLTAETETKLCSPPLHQLAAGADRLYCVRFSRCFTAHLDPSTANPLFDRKAMIADSSVWLHTL
ncbi:hypothetical protein B296_00052835 [Ensete ventricosum]|uniref:Uncharacterized protein n=1 Tax=Ensete ventricosum TaxID=4639 RepID=A0A426X5H8_ENSVE|nr:hypothetical protein B296_00052835 [Ensete ventricosum]